MNSAESARVESARRRAAQLVVDSHQLLIPVPVRVLELMGSDGCRFRLAA